MNKQQKLRVALAQIDVIAADPSANLIKGEAYIKEAANQSCQLVLFPEMWTTGFYWPYNNKNFDKQEAYIEKISQLAKKYNIWIAGTNLAESIDNQPKNTFFLFDNEGNEVARYDKTHLFSFAGEDKHISPGDKMVLVNTPWGKCGLATCYDIRFPELFRYYALKGANFFLLPTAFPHPRKAHLHTLIVARSIENQMFCITTNQVGLEGKREKEPPVYFGSSCVIDPWGKTIAHAPESEEKLVVCDIDLSRVKEVRDTINVFNDRRPDLYGNCTPN